MHLIIVSFALLALTAVKLATAQDLATRPAEQENVESVQSDDSEFYARSVANENELGALLLELDELRKMGQPAEALLSAQQISQLIEEHYGEGMQLARSLVPVVELQLELEDMPAAEESLSRMMDLIERFDNVFSRHLVDPLTVLADIYSRANRREEAIIALRRARHITHRKLGILNMEQIEIADQLASNYYAMGNIKDANRENRFAFRVNINEFGEDSADLVPAINKLAGWYEKIGEFSLARQFYKKSIEMIEREYGEDDLRLVNQLQRVARTYRGEQQLRGEGREALKRAVNIFDSHPEADSVARGMSLVDLGDWQMALSRRRDAIDTYRVAWNILTGDGTSPEKGATVFGRPKRLRFNPPLPNPMEFTGVDEVFVDVTFIVTPDGSVTDVEVTDSSAHWRLQNEVRLAMRNSRYRPTFKNGEPTSAKMNFRWTYRVPNHARKRVARPQDADQSNGSATKN